MTLIKCACGCGEWIEDKNKWGRSRRFVNMHQCRGINNPMYGRKGKSNPNYGNHLSKEHKQKLIESRDSEAVRRKISKSLTGKHPSEKTREKLRKSRKGRTFSDGHKQKLVEALKGKHLKDIGISRDELYNLYWIIDLNATEIAKLCDVSNKTILTRLDDFNIKRKTISEIRASVNFRKRISEASIKNWQNPEFIKKVMNGLNAKPNKLEKKVNTVLQKNFPNEWKYNGDFSQGVVLNGMIPDFVNVNGVKAVIEVFGDAYHNPEKAFMNVSYKRQEFGRKSTYSQLGYKCVILWEHDLKNDNVVEFVVNTVRRELE